MRTLSEKRNGIWFITIVFTSLVSGILLSVLTAASAFETDRGLLSYIPKPYDKLLGIDADDAQKAIESETREADSVEVASVMSVKYGLKEDRTLMTSDEKTLSWKLLDSKRNEYHITLTQQEYVKYTSNLPIEIQYLAADGGKVMAVVDYTKYVQANNKLTQLADAIYENAASDREFLQEVSYIISQSTRYEQDMTEEASLTFETLFSGKGDCEDLIILMASIIGASSYTNDWEIQMVYFDASNSGKSETANHLALFIDTVEFSTFVESTNPELNGLTVWNKVNGWYLTVS